MAITIADFGSDVDEVQVKLSALLPNFDTGQKTIEAIRGDNDYNGYTSEALDAIDVGGLTTIDYAKRIYEGCEKVDEGIGNAFEDGKKLLDDDIKEAEQVDGELKSAQDTLESELRERAEKISSASNDYKVNVESVSEMVDALEKSWVSIDSDYTTLRDQVTGKIADASTRHIKHHEDLIRQLMAFEADGMVTITETSLGPISLFDDTIADMKEEADKLFPEIRREIDEILDTVDADRQGMTENFCDQFRASASTVPGTLGALAAAAVENMDDCKNDCLDKLQTEMDETQEAGEKAKSTMDDVSTKVDDVQEVKQSADSMNQSM